MADEPTSVFLVSPGEAFDDPESDPLTPGARTVPDVQTSPPSLAQDGLIDLTPTVPGTSGMFLGRPRLLRGFF